MYLLGDGDVDDGGGAAVRPTAGEEEGAEEEAEEADHGFTFFLFKNHFSYQVFHKKTFFLDTSIHIFVINTDIEISNQITTIPSIFVKRTYIRLLKRTRYSSIKKTLCQVFMWFVGFKYCISLHLFSLLNSCFYISYTKPTFF